MQLQRERDTKPEVRLRQELHRRGLRFRLDRRIVPGAPRRAVDIVFGPARVAVLVDGCFWHGCPAHGRRSHEVNEWYWPKKIQTNVMRDRDTDARLSAAGWLVVRVWEHEDPASVAENVAEVIASRRRAPASPHSSSPGPRRRHRQL